MGDCGSCRVGGWGHRAVVTAVRETTKGPGWPHGQGKGKAKAPSRPRATQGLKPEASPGSSPHNQVQQEQAWISVAWRGL